MRPLGSVDYCEICGKEYVVNSSRQRFCPDCAKSATKENVKELKKQYYNQNKEKIFAYKTEMRSNRNVCVICGKIFDAETPITTCSPECKKEYMRQKQNKADIRRGKRKLPADQRYDSGLPKSGIPGVTYRRNNGKWSASYKRHYIGVFKTIEEAKEAIELYKKSQE